MVRDIKYWIDKRLHLPITIPQVANVVRKNPDYANRVFRTIMRVSLSEYIIRQRMEKAGLLLREGRLVKEASFLSGYGDVKHFAKMFQKHHGMSPSTFRQSTGLIYRN